MRAESEAAAGRQADGAPAAFRIRIADAVIEIHPLHQGIRRLCEGYVVGEASLADFTVRTSQADIEAERAIATANHPWSDAYLETLSVLRAIAGWAPQHRRLLVHGAVIQYAGKAYLFTAPSGTGKSTHIMLWRQYLGADVRVVNGDKPLVRVPQSPDEQPIVYGTPWAGKENWQENASAPLAGIVLLSRSVPGASRIRKADPAALLDRVLRQVYLPNDTLAASNTLELLDALLSRVPLYELACDMSEDAVRVSFETLTGQPYRPAI